MPLTSSDMPDNEESSSRLLDFFLARQPILDRDQGLVAYELLFRSANRNEANVTDDLAATASVIAHAAELGLANVIGDSLGFVNVDAAVLCSDFIRFLPAERAVLEILETVKADDRLVARVAELSQAGYVFALDDVVSDSPDLRRLLPFVSIFKIDLMAVDRARLPGLVARLKGGGRKLLAEKVETQDDFELCLGLGFDYFQGYYFAKPAVMSGKKLSPSQMALVRIITQINTDADNSDIEHSMKQDGALSLMLLRLVNTPAVGVGTHVDSIGKALMLMGRRQLSRWLQILLYANPGKHSLSPLMVMATTRGKLLESLARKARPSDRTMADTAFTVGIMSMLDALFGSSMAQIVAEIPVGDDVAQALVEKKGFYGELLELVESLEHMQNPEVCMLPAMRKLQLSNEELYSLQVAAYEWSDEVARSAKAA